MARDMQCPRGMTTLSTQRTAWAVYWHTVDTIKGHRSASKVLGMARAHLSDGLRGVYARRRASKALAAHTALGATVVARPPQVAS